MEDLSRRLINVVMKNDLDLSEAPVWRRWTPEKGSCVDLDNPSNEGHLRRLTESVLGRTSLVSSIEGMWVVAQVRLSERGVLVPRTFGKGSTPGQAYAAAVVGAFENDVPEGSDAASS